MRPLQNPSIHWSLLPPLTPAFSLIWILLPHQILLSTSSGVTQFVLLPLGWGESWLCAWFPVDSSGYTQEVHQHIFQLWATRQELVPATQSCGGGYAGSQVHKLNLLMSRVTTNMPVIAVRSYYEEASRGYHLGIFGCYSITREVPLFMTSCNREFQSHAGDLAIDVAVQEIDCLRPWFVTAYPFHRMNQGSLEITVLS